MTTPKAVQPFKRTFVLLVRDNGQLIEGDTVVQTLARLGLRVSKNPDIASLFTDEGTLVPKYDNGFPHKEPPYFLSDQLGTPVPLPEILAAVRQIDGYWDERRAAARKANETKREEGERRQDMLERRLLKRKKNIHKIKTTYAKERQGQRWRWWDYRCSHYETYTNVTGRSYYRNPKTLQEMKWNEAHGDCEMKEYGPLVRRRRLYLPTCWDDFPIAARDAEHSWKHHSKRPKQYKGR